MTNKNALTLALVMAGLAAASYRYGYKGTAIVAIMAGCVFALWPIRLKWGLAGREQWREIRPKGRAHFVIAHGVAFCGVLAVWTIAPSYVADNHLPPYWAWLLFSFLCVGCLGGEHANGNTLSRSEIVPKYRNCGQDLLFLRLDGILKHPITLTTVAVILQFRDSLVGSSMPHQGQNPITMPVVFFTVFNDCVLA